MIDWVIDWLIELIDWFWVIEFDWIHPLFRPVPFCFCVLCFVFFCFLFLFVCFLKSLLYHWLFILRLLVRFLLWVLLYYFDVGASLPSPVVVVVDPTCSCNHDSDWLIEEKSSTPSSKIANFRSFFFPQWIATVLLLMNRSWLGFITPSPWKVSCWFPQLWLHQWTFEGRGDSFHLLNMINWFAFIWLLWLFAVWLCICSHMEYNSLLKQTQACSYAHTQRTNTTCHNTTDTQHLNVLHWVTYSQEEAACTWNRNCQRHSTTVGRRDHQEMIGSAQ